MVRFGVLLTVCSFVVVNAEQEQYDVYWNSSNPLFEPFDNAIDSPGYYELAARPLDIIKFHCPRRKAKEYSLIHKVSFEEFQRCSLGTTAELVGSCDGERHVIHHTLRQDEFQPEQVYFITTSSGKKDGLYVRRLGLCNEKNMRLAVLFGTEAMIERRDPILGTDVDLQELLQNRFYLAEENGELNWKKNVLPDVVFDWKSYLQNHNRKLKFDKSIQIEPIPLDDDFISQWKQLRNQREQNEIGFLSQTEEIAEKFESAGSSITVTALSYVVVLLFWM